jgi:flagellar basal-body rod modification protein FlgD
MTEVTSGSLSSILNDFAIQEKPKDTELGRDEFLKLLVTQLENQDPLSPQENGAFVAQLAQFSSLEEAQNLSSSFDGFANNFLSTQHLQATSLVGRPVHVASQTTLLADEGAISVLADISVPTDSATMSVFNDAGSLIDTFELGPQSAGRNEFIWTGKNAENTRHPVGLYRFVVSATSNGTVGEVPVYLSSNVNSVTIEPGGSLTLNLAGIGPTSLSEVIQIN